MKHPPVFPDTIFFSLGRSKREVIASVTTRDNTNRTERQHGWDRERHNRTKDSMNRAEGSLSSVGTIPVWNNVPAAVS